MASVSLTLDEIINAQRKSKRQDGGGGGFNRRRMGGDRAFQRNRGGGRSTYKSLDDVDDRWEHDKFYESNGGGDVGARPQRFSSRGGATDGKIVKLNIWNLSNTVVTRDLEELFVDYDIQGVAVHYDEGGNHLGSADLFVPRSSASDIMQEFVGVLLDGKEMKFALVDESRGPSSSAVRDRLQRGNGFGGGRSSSFNRVRTGNVRKGFNGGGGRNATNGDGAGKRMSKMSADDLDKELEAYMTKKGE
jgi:hypothetical protein